MNRLRPLLTALLLPLLLPVQLATLHLRYRLGRLQAARTAGDRGSISIELALAVIALVAIAGTVLALINGLAGKVEKKVPDVSPAVQ